MKNTAGRLAAICYNPSSCTRLIGCSLLFSLLLLAILPPTIWHSNEVSYFSLAHHFYNPDAFKVNTVFFDPGNARFMGFYIIGFLVDKLGYELAHVILKTFAAFMLGFVLAYFIIALNIESWRIVLTVIVFLLLGQGYFGGEHIFKTVETKTFSYALIFLAFSFIWQHKYRAATFSLVIATYFHFLVGGFWSFALFGLAVMLARNINLIVKHGIAYLFLITPLIVIIFSQYLTVGETNTYGITLSANEIYAAIRAPHHVAPFVSSEFFLLGWLPGIILMVYVLACCVLAGKSSKGEYKSYLLWLVLLHAYLVLALAIAVLDRNMHIFAPLYMFRPSALILFLSILFLTGYFKAKMSFKYNRLFSILILSFALIWALITVAPHISNNNQGLWQFFSEKEQVLLDKIRQYTEEDATILLQPAPNEIFKLEFGSKWLPLEILTGRQALINFKFIGSEKDDFLRWHHLHQWREKVFRGECEQIKLYPDVNYLITVEAATFNAVKLCGRVIWRSDSHAIIEIE